MAEAPEDQATEESDKVALEALRGDRRVQEIAAKHRQHPNHVSTWMPQVIISRGV